MTMNTASIETLAPAMERYRALYKEYLETSPEDLVRGNLIARLASSFAELAPLIGGQVLEELDEICEQKLAEIEGEQ